MGFFDFDNKKKEEPTPQPKPITLSGILLAGVLATCGYIAKFITESGKGIIVYLFTHEGPSQKINSVKRGIGITILLVASLLIYTKIPQVRDWTLQSPTINIPNTSDEQIHFPENKYFHEKEWGKYYKHLWERDYFFFHRLSGNQFSPWSGSCQMVPRGEYVAIYTYNIPVYAVGFDDDVRYGKDIAEQDNDKQTITLEKTTWKNIQSNWDEIPSYIGKGFKRVLTMKAHNFQNALICF
jgi:hypothetical protein